jgi:hypothetical protein
MIEGQDRTLVLSLAKTLAEVIERELGEFVTTPDRCSG